MKRFFQIVCPYTKYTTEEECMNCSQNPDENFCEIPTLFLKELYDSSRKFKIRKRCFSVTQLNLCDYYYYYCLTHKKIFVKIDFRHLFGTLLHRGIASIIPNSSEILVGEKFKTSNGIPFFVYGNIDYVEEKENSITIFDWKTSQLKQRLPYLNHILQINIYKYLFEKCTNKKVNQMILFYMSFDNIMKLPVVSLNKEDILSYLQRRAERLIEIQKEPPKYVTFTKCKFCIPEIYLKCSFKEPTPPKLFNRKILFDKKENLEYQRKLIESWKFSYNIKKGDNNEL